MNKRLYIILSFMLLVLALGACGSLNKITPEGLDDEAMLADVKGKLVEDVELKGFEIKVGVNDGVVTLDGHVESKAQRTKAGQAAKEVSGVRRVVNNLHVKGR